MIKQSPTKEINEFQTFTTETITIKGINLLVGILLLLRLNYLTKKIERMIVNP
jgi:hypothetical protein